MGLFPTGWTVCPGNHEGPKMLRLYLEQRGLGMELDQEFGRRFATHTARAAIQATSATAISMCVWGSLPHFAQCLS